MSLLRSAAGRRTTSLAVSRSLHAYSPAAKYLTSTYTPLLSSCQRPTSASSTFHTNAPIRPLPLHSKPTVSLPLSRPAGSLQSQSRSTHSIALPATPAGLLNQDVASSQHEQSHSQSEQTQKQRLLIASAVASSIALALMYNLQTVHAQSNSHAFDVSENPAEPAVEKIAESAATPAFPFLTRAWLWFKLFFRLPVLGVMWLPIFSLIFFLSHQKWFLYYVVWVLEHSGPGFVKLGQWAATRPDLFDQQACNILATLQTGARPHSLKFSLKSIAKMFPWLIIDVETKEKIKNFHTPKNNAEYQHINQVAGNLRLVVDGNKMLGSGSMAQTHKGVVIFNNDPNDHVEVAIKILHPSINNRVESDLMLMRSVAGIIDRLPGGFKWLGAGDAIAQFSGFLHSHLDLTGEGRNLERFAENFKSWSTIKFPIPVAGLASPHVLVETLEKGIQLSDFLDENSPALRAHCRPIAKLGLSMFLTMMVDHNFIHADLHPGNIICEIDCATCKAEEAAKKLDKQQQGKGHWKRAARVKTTDHSNAEAGEDIETHVDELHHAKHDVDAKVKLLVIDPGLVTELSPQNRQNFLALFGALVVGDGREAAELILKYARKQSCTDPEGFKNEMEKIISDIPLLDIGSADVGVLLQKTLTLVRNYQVGLETDFASLVVGLMVVEGVGRRLDPKLSLVKEAAPVLAKNSEARHVLMSRTSPKVWMSLGKAAAKWQAESLQQDKDHRLYYEMQHEALDETMY